MSTTAKSLPRAVQSEINRRAHQAAQHAYAAIRARLQDAVAITIKEGRDWRAAIEKSAETSQDLTDCQRCTDRAGGKQDV